MIIAEGEGDVQHAVTETNGTFRSSEMIINSAKKKNFSLR